VKKVAIVKRRPLELWEPFREMRTLQDRVNRLFESAFGYPVRTETPLLREGWLPPVDIHEDSNNIYLKAELPGIKKDELNIAVEGDTLTIKGEKKHESEVKEEQFHVMERTYGSFSRSFSLPTNVDSSKVRADYKDGVLTLTLPKKEESKPKKIEVKVS